MPDHVHILMEVDPQFGIHKAVKSLKGYTSKVLRSEFPMLKTKMSSLWTNSYFVSTVGGASLGVIKHLAVADWFTTEVLPCVKKRIKMGIK